MTKTKQPIISIPTGKLYKITKLGKVTNPFNPNSDYGDSLPYFIGVYTTAPKVGKCFNLLPLGFDNPKYHGIRTSLVTKRLSNNTFETMNSIYKIEPYNEKD